MKVSSSTAKTTSQGRKQVWRHADGDVIGLAGEDRDGTPLLEEVMRDGKRLAAPYDLAVIRQRCLDQTAALRPGVVGGTWTVRRSSRLDELRAATMQRLAKTTNGPHPEGRGPHGQTRSS